MTPADNRFFQTMAHHDGRVRRDRIQATYPVYPRGDRRKNPIGWIESDRLDDFLTEGTLVAANDGIRLAKPEEMALPDTASRDRILFSPKGSLRRARVNTKHSVLDILADWSDLSGQLYFTAYEIEAGQQFARDYIRGGMGRMATQNVAAPLVDNGRRDDSAEMRIINDMDRRRRVQEAIACLGAGLDSAAIAVCCENWSLDKLERTEKWAKNTGMTILKLALQRLSEFYGTIPGQRARTRRGG